MNTTWQIGTLIKKEMAAHNIVALTFSLPQWLPFLSGQYFDIELRSADGYRALRSYSIASAPEEKGSIQFGIEIIPNGEVSTYLARLEIGQQIEMRGPIGEHFVWHCGIEKPLILIGGGSGMVPLMSMLRHHLNNLEKSKPEEIIVMVSARTINHVLWREELEQAAKRDSRIKITITLTQETPPQWQGFNRRIDKDILSTTIEHLYKKPVATYVCGSTSFVGSLSRMLLEMGFDFYDIKTERFN
jgi:ferredoxin-NADP reductase